MKPNTQNLGLAILTFLILTLAGIHLNAAPAGTAFTYQGRLNSGATNANGSYDLTFKLFDALSGPSQVGATVTNSAIDVGNGLFTVVLDFGPGMFTGSARWLEISIRTNGTGAFTTLGPRQALTPTPYALYATNAAIASTASTVIPGAVTAAGIQSGQVVKSLNGLMDNVTLSAGANVTLTPSGNNLQISSSGVTSGWALGGNSGTTSANFLGTTDTQPLVLKANNARLLKLDPNPGAPNLLGGAPGNFISAGIEGATLAGGGTFGTLGGSYTNSIRANYSTLSGGLGNLIAAGAYESTILGGNQNQIQSDAYRGAIGGGILNLIAANAYESAIAGGNQNVVQLGAAQSFIGGGFQNVGKAFRSTIGGGDQNVIGLGAYQSTVVGGTRNEVQTNSYYSFIGGGQFNRIMNDAQVSAICGGSGNSIQSGASYSVVGGGSGNVIQANGFGSFIAGGSQNTASGIYSVIPGGFQNWAPGSYAFAAGLRAKAVNNGTFVWADSTDADFGDSGVNTFNVRAGGGATFVTAQDALRLYGFQPFLTILDSGSGNARGRIQNVNGELVIQPESFVSGGNPNSFMRVENSGNVSVATLTIRGGADVAEPFELSEQNIAKGLVVIIDPENPGKLKLSERAYDNRVAGIVSGANGINPGIALHQEGALEGGQNVALSGRVYVQADATYGAIKPGDLLTTSATAGHAMKVTNHAKAQGAILGKAMSSLKQGKGMVLVLVTLE